MQNDVLYNEIMKKIDELEPGGGDIIFDIGNENLTLNKTWTEISEALSAGKIVRIVGNGYVAYVSAVNTDEEFWFVYVVGDQGVWQASSADGYPQYVD